MMATDPHNARVLGMCTIGPAPNFTPWNRLFNFPSSAPELPFFLNASLTDGALVRLLRKVS